MMRTERGAAVKTLLLGMGNPILRDDAVGLRLASGLSRLLGAVRDLDVVPETSAGGLELLAIVEGYDRLIVCDAVRSRGGTPGAWYHFTGIDLRDTLHLTSVHDVNFATALELGRRLGLAVPAPSETHVFGVEVEDACTFDEQMTPALEGAFRSCLEGILPEVARILFVRPAAASGETPASPDVARSRPRPTPAAGPGPTRSPSRRRRPGSRRSRAPRSS